MADKAISARKGQAAAIKGLALVGVLAALDAVFAAALDPATLGVLTGPLVGEHPWIVLLVPVVQGYLTARANWKKHQGVK